MMVSTFGAGMSMGMPDTCKTPPFAIPAPFPNLGQNAMAVPAYFTVMILCLPEMTVGAMYPITNGDEAGVMGGVASGMIIGPGQCMLGSTTYFVGGMPSWRMTAMTIQNGTNAPGTTIVPSQSIVIVLR